MRTRDVVIGIASLVVSGAAFGQTVILTPVQDATLYEVSSGGIANGAGENLFVGNTMQSETRDERRMLVQFDLAAGVPAGATITSVEMRLRVNRAQNSGPFTYSMHRVLQSWVEGTSDAVGGEGIGAPTQHPSATWIHASSSTVTFSANSSSVQPSR